jgi:hypothetical protein
MQNLRIGQDIKPLSEVRNGMATNFESSYMEIIEPSKVLRNGN